MALHDNNPNSGTKPVKLIDGDRDRQQEPDPEPVMRTPFGTTIIGTVDGTPVSQETGDIY